jgi:hypothetical protein
MEAEPKEPVISAQTEPEEKWKEHGYQIGTRGKDE